MHVMFQVRNPYYFSPVRVCRWTLYNSMAFHPFCYSVLIPTESLSPWTVKWPDSANFLLQTLQLCGLSSVWEHIWLFELPEHTNFLLHLGQETKNSYKKLVMYTNNTKYNTTTADIRHFSVWPGPYNSRQTHKWL